MNLQFKKKEEFETQHEKQGIILIYENKIYIAEKNDEVNSSSKNTERKPTELSFESLSSEVAKKAKKSITDISRTGIQLIFCRDKENIYLTADRNIDVFKFAQNSSQYFTLLKEAFE
jgi:hypothetical protein